ncbi:hypothetical protein ACR80L_09550 [Bacillus velezensis]|uniref:hypothetical protein n=1 Tax=Bacillus velezensis TaxID=492670 RepID=UPI00052AB03D|nr:hypothetical protein [Bacillus velezensis]AIU77436.1 hypothetical protein MA22_13245 [Bacillus subtilis]AOO61813.1 hypothetical protein BBJ33_09785 [Bacillus velezensis]NGM58520.1 hypothetical protein [Bacillus velezensis]
MTIIYAQLEIDEIELKTLRENGVIKIKGYFDYEYGIQLNLSGKHYAFHQNGITLQKLRTDGYGTLTVTYGNRDAYIDSNPKMQITTALTSKSNLVFSPDNIVFFKDKNCRLLQP